MEVFVCSTLWILVGLLAVPVTVLCLEIFLGVLGPPFPNIPRNASRQRVAVLVPAHNESTGIVPTLEDVKAQLRPDDRLLVVADNCSDDTAAVSGSLGAEVVHRYDNERIGKGYALDYGLRHLGGDPPEIVIMIDADCQLEECAIDRLASVCSATGRPAQACYLMTTPDGSQHTNQVAEFAWRVKNWVRPLRAWQHRLALPISRHRHGRSLAFDPQCRCRKRVARGGPQARTGLGRRRTRAPILSLGPSDKSVRPYCGGGR